MSLLDNNPGNMKSTSGDFQAFDTPKAGLDAMQRDLLLKVNGQSPVMKSQYGDNYQPTLSNVINTWAPPSENDTKNYVDFVAKHAGIDPNTPLTPDDVPKIMAPMVQMEGGQKASQYFGKLMATAPKQAADSGQIQSDGLPDGFVVDKQGESQSNGLPDGFVVDSAPAAKKPDTFDTVADQGLQGATFGFGDEAQAGLAALVASGINGKPISENYTQAKTIAAQRLSDESKQSPVTSALANLGGGIATGLGGAATKPGAAIATWLGGGNLPARIAKGAIAGATSGGLYGTGTADEGNRLQGAEQGAITGGIIGGAIPAVSAAAGAVKNLVLPSVSAEAKPLAEKALDYGIPVSRSQIGNSKVAKTIASTASEIPLSGGQQFYDKQTSAFNNAISKTFGEDADKITPDVIDNAYKNIGKKYDNALAGKSIPITNKTIDTLNQIKDTADSYITPDHAKIVSNTIDKIVGAQTGGRGTIAGEKLGSLRSQITSILGQTRNDASPYLRQIRDAIVDMSTTAAPELRTANAQYKALKTIEPLAIKATESGGNISPALLQARVASSYRDYSRGGGGALGDLARIGQRFIKETVPNSGTARRLAAYHILAAAPGAAVGAYENPESPIGGAVLGGLGTMAAARGYNAANTYQPLVQRAIQSNPQIPSALAALISGNISQQMRKRP